MAEMCRWDPIDLRDFNLNQLYGTAKEHLFYDNENITVNGRDYADILEDDYTVDGQVQTMEWYGYGIVRSGLKITAGTLTATYNWFYDQTDQKWYYFSEVRGFSISAVELYKAQKTVSTADDDRLLSKMLAGNDRIELKSSGADYMEGRDGNDSILGGAGGDSLFGGSGRDVLKGEADNDLLDGGLGNDSLDGGLGLDRLTGGAGNDTLTGGKGASRDTFIFAKSGGTDRITDFQDGVDRIAISTGAERFADLHLSTHGSSVWVEFGGTTVILDNVTKAQLSAADFNFV